VFRAKFSTCLRGPSSEKRSPASQRVAIVLHAKLSALTPVRGLVTLSETQRHPRYWTTKRRGVCLLRNGFMESGLCR
jgi:hypothetical protein